MKTPSTFLYDLVKTLTKSEKRYIKVQAGSGEKDYIQLLDALNAQKTFDEDKLIADHKGANFIKHLAVNKRYLYELLLQSLAHFGQQSLEDKVYEKITAANVLIEKGLFEAAVSELKKGHKVAQKYELFELQILLCGIEKKLLNKQRSKTKNNQAIDQVFNIEMHSLEQLANTSEYWYLAQQIIQFQKRNQKIQNKQQQQQVEDLTQLPKFQNFYLASNFRSKLYFYHANATHQFTLGNVEKAYEFNKGFLGLLEEYPHFLRLYAERYLATLNNMLIDSLISGKFDVLKEGINRLTAIIKRPEFKSIKNIEARVFRQRYLLLINWSLSQNDFGKVLEWIPEIEAGLAKFGKKIEKHHRVTFYYLVAYLLFHNKRFEQASEWNNLILNDHKEDVVKEIYYFARILNLILHYELGNHTLLESLLLSTPKYLRARRNIYETEKALFRFLRKQLNTINKKEQKQLNIDFKEEINNLFLIPEEKRVFNYLDLRLWIDKGSHTRCATA